MISEVLQVYNFSCFFKYIFLLGQNAKMGDREHWLRCVFTDVEGLLVLLIFEHFH